MAGCFNGLSQPGFSQLLFCTLAEKAPSEARGLRGRREAPLIPDLSSSSLGVCRRAWLHYSSVRAAWWLRLRQTKAGPQHLPAKRGHSCHQSNEQAAEGAGSGEPCSEAEKLKEAPPPFWPTGLPGPRVIPWPLPEPRKIPSGCSSWQAQNAVGASARLTSPTCTVVHPLIRWSAAASQPGRSNPKGMSCTSDLDTLSRSWRGESPGTSLP